MLINCNSFFDGEFSYVNMNQLFLANSDKIKDSKDPAQIQAVLDSLGKLTYGGYGEDRKDIWNGTYMDECGNYIHLGIDINVPVGTPVRSPIDADVFDVFTDTDVKIGWGGRIILKQPMQPYLTLAHMAPSSLTTKKFVKKGEIIGVVGTWPTNGNTFHHLHVQINRHLNLDKFDGYGFVSDLDNCRNPFLEEFFSVYC